MGCSESKDLKPITVADAQRKLESSLEGLAVVRLTHSASNSISSSGNGSSLSSVPHTPEDKLLRHQDSKASLVEDLPLTLDSIPTNDLGESLDCRRGRASWLKQPGAPPTSVTTTSARSVDSSDSGIYDLDDDYSFVITENSPPELIKRVEADFTPVENLDLTVTGKQCPRLLSGYQKARQEEQSILESLREEGFITTSRQKAGRGVAYEIIEATPQTESAGSGKFKPKDFLPQETKQHLESQRNKHSLRDLTHADVSMKMHLANERRQAELESVKERMASLYKKEDSEDKRRLELEQKMTKQNDSALEKREAHLRELRDKLQAKNKRAQHVKLKKLINGPPVPVPLGPTSRAFNGKNLSDNFFD
ncbi:uncharacterized protein [Procambarus clarkii]|uniref:uncharacterized protein n=1 Tax=Procambarus clarkii TaxID=6728 RepID=UPI001E6749C4|nr:uncharacterized protein LOC123761302 [Procambarus clarkii]